MSRSGYSDDCDDTWALIRWRGAVTSAIRGKRGQAFLRELIGALDAMPEKRLIAEELACPDGVCAMGAVAAARGLDPSQVDPYDRGAVARFMGLPHAMVAEIAFENDGDFCGRYNESPEQRWARMRAWAQSQLFVPGEVSP
jgi:hypothetical protein